MIADDSLLSPPEEEWDETECLRRVTAGDQDAARELVAQIRPVIVRIVRRRLPRRELEADLMQEVYIKLFSRLSQYQREAPFVHWVARIAVRTCLDHLRAQRCRPELRWADLPEDTAARMGAVLADPHSRHPGERMGVREIVAQAMNGLKPEDRRVVELFHFGQHSIEEIGRLTGWNVEFVKMRLFRARGKLRRLVQKMPKWDSVSSETPRNPTRRKGGRRLALSPGRARGVSEIVVARTAA